MAAEGATVELPPLSELGDDLVEMPATWRAAVIASPFVCTALFFVCAARGWWWLAVPLVGLHTFLSYGSVSHDLVHANYRLSVRTSDVLLALVELTGLRSGHAYRATHMYHHRRFPDESDPEGAPARMSWYRALLEGPVYLYRLGFWAWARARRQDRLFMFAESAGCIAYGVLALGLFVKGRTAVALVYGVLVVAASWVFPFGFVYLMHDPKGKSALFQTRLLRGRIVPALLFQHTYHLEHHLYPTVPAWNWRKLARRLDPVLERAGVVPILLP